MGNNNQTMSLKLKIWRQPNAQSAGQMEDYSIDGVSPDMSFLEMIDVLNEKLVSEGKDAVAFDHDCREGICGMCSLMINGQAHGPENMTTTCQLHMRKFKDGDTVVIEPFRAKPFPVLKDLMVDRSAFDTIQAAGGFIDVNTGNAQDANSTPIAKENADLAMDAAACIGCAACVASCKNASAMLFVSAKVSQYDLTTTITGCILQYAGGDIIHSNSLNNFFQYRYVLMLHIDSLTTGNVFRKLEHGSNIIGC